MKFLDKFFSIKHSERSKIFVFCGIKFKIKINKFKKYEKLEVQKNKIVFSNFMGKGFGCNPKYIAKEILKRKLPYDLVWLYGGGINDFPEEIKLVSYNEDEAYENLATAKIWIDNQRKVPHIYKGLMKKDGQCYIQTWHGSLGIKKLDADIEKFNDDVYRCWREAAKIDSAMTDYLTSNSLFENKIFKDALWYDDVIIKKVGHPRNDIFFYDEEKKEDIRNKVLKLFDISNDNKILLYVPSFRDNGSVKGYDIDIVHLREVLVDKFGGEWTILIRLHPRISQSVKQLFPLSESYKDASLYPDIQELLVTADVAITDYSSCIFDFMLQRKPAFIFASDQDEFDEDRGFYYPLRATPFPVAEDNEELKQNILNFDLAQYQQKVDEFLAGKGCMEDGHAAERVVDLIEDIMKQRV